MIDDHSRVAYVEAHDDETKETATAVLRNAVAWFADRGVTVQRVLSDNGSCYHPTSGAIPAPSSGITPKKTRPYRPQTNGKIERFHRTLAEGWAFKKFYNSESARLAALPAWVHQYNHHRPHSAIGKAAPIPARLPLRGAFSVSSCLRAITRSPTESAGASHRLRPRHDLEHQAGAARRAAGRRTTGGRP